MVACNTTLEDAIIEGNEAKYSYGLTFHEVGLIVSAIFALLSTSIAIFLIFMHATHYLKPWEQKHIIRILFMIPVYSLVSFLSYYFYRHAIYFEVLRDCYEAFAIASFFTLLCHYVAPNLHEQKEFFRGLRPVKNWILPINWLQKCSGGLDHGTFRRPTSGLTWFNIIWICVFQYCFIRVFFTVVSVLAQSTDRYCEASLNPSFAHIWVLIFDGSSVSIAMYALIQFYHQLKDEIAEHRPFMKLLCIKLVIFFSFWQSLLISFLSSSSGPLQPSAHIAYPDIKVGIPSMLLTLEMTIFAVLHFFAFPWKGPYAISKDTNSTNPLYAHGSGFSGKAAYSGGKFGWRAFANAFNPWDIVKASARGARWLFVGRKHRRNDSSYHPHLGADVDSSSSHFDGGVPAASHGTKLQPIPSKYSAQQPLYAPSGNPSYEPQHLAPYPPRPTRGRSDSHSSDGLNADGVWDAQVQTPSRTPSPYAMHANPSGYFQAPKYGGNPSLNPAQTLSSDDRRGLLRDAAGPGVDGTASRFTAGRDADFDMHREESRLHQQRSLPGLARAKEAEESPVEPHPALRTMDVLGQRKQGGTSQNGMGRDDWL